MIPGNTWRRAGAAWSLRSGELVARVYQQAGDELGLEAGGWRWWLARAGWMGDVCIPGPPLVSGRAGTAQLARDDADRALMARRFQGAR